METGHSKHLQKDVHNEGIVDGHHQLNVTWVTRTFEAFVTASEAEGISIVG